MEDIVNNKKENLYDDLTKLFKETENLFDSNLPIDENLNFKLSDVLDLLCLNYIKINPKYYFQKFKIYFVKFFTMEEYFFKMEHIKTENIKEKIDSSFEFTKTKKNEKKIEKNDRFKSVDNKISNELITKDNIKIINRAKSIKNSTVNIQIIPSYLPRYWNKDENSNKDNKSSISKSNKASKSLYDISEIKKSSSFSYEQIQGLIGIGVKEKINKKEEFPDYKLKLIKSNLNLDDKDEMSGKAYEEYSRKILKIMFMLVTKKEIFFENPTKIVYSTLIDFYLNNYFKYSFEIDKPIKNILYDNMQDEKELDIVYEMKYEELINVSNKFKSYFLIDNIHTNKKIIGTQITDKITFIGEISKNIIKQGKEKLSQILNYVKIISIMNSLSTSKIVCKRTNDDYKNIYEEYKTICADYKCSPESEKVFCIITNGDYKKLKLIVNLIEVLINKPYSEDTIKNSISKLIDGNKIIFSDETNIESLEDNIYSNYLIFANLKKNNIKHALIYIGDISKINYDDKFKEMFNINLNINNSEESLNLNNIRTNYFELKKIIKQFEKNLSDITAPGKDKMDQVFLGMQTTIKNIYYKSSIIKKIRKNLRFDGFLFFRKNDKSIFPLIEKSNALKLIKSLFNLKISEIKDDEINNLINEIEECPEQYGKKIVFLVNDIKYFKKNLKEFFYLPKNIYNIFFAIQVNQKIKVGFFFPNNFMKNLPLEISVKKIIDVKMKNRKKEFEKEIILQKDNLRQKIESDLNYLFKMDEFHYSFLNKLKDLNFSIEDEKKNNIIIYFNQALNLFEELHGKLEKEKKHEIIDDIKSKIRKLYENIFSLNIYTNIFKKLPKIISDLILVSIKKEMSNFIVELEKLIEL